MKTALGIEDVEFVSRGRIIRVFIDADDGVTIDDCALFSREMSRILDRLETLDQAYRLEVSSPGLDRPFRTLARFQRNLNRKIDVVLKEPLPKGSFVRGTLLRATAEEICVLPEGEADALALPMGQVKRATLTVEIDAGKGRN